MNLLAFAPVQTELDNITRRVKNSHITKMVKPAPLLLSDEFRVQSEKSKKSKITRSPLMKDVQGVATRFSFWANATFIGALAVAAASVAEPQQTARPIDYQIKQDSNHALEKTVLSHRP